MLARLLGVVLLFGSPSSPGAVRQSSPDISEDEALSIASSAVSKTGAVQDETLSVASGPIAIKGEHIQDEPSSVASGSAMSKIGGDLDETSTAPSGPVASTAGHIQDETSSVASGSAVSKTGAAGGDKDETTSVASGASKVEHVHDETSSVASGSAVSKTGGDQDKTTVASIHIASKAGHVQDEASSVASSAGSSSIPNIEWEVAYCRANDIEIDVCTATIEERTKECAGWMRSRRTSHLKSQTNNHIVHFEVGLRCMRFFTEREKRGGPMSPIVASKGGNLLSREGATWKNLFCASQRWPERGEDCANKIIEQLQACEDLVLESQEGVKRRYGLILRMQCEQALKIMDTWEDSFAD